MQISQNSTSTEQPPVNILGVGISALNSCRECVSKCDYNLSVPRDLNSDSTLIQQSLKWEPIVSLIVVLRKTFDWIGMQTEESYAAPR